jgi:hypothetical protein
MRSRWTVRLGCCVLTTAAVTAVPTASAQGGPRASLTKRDAAVVERAREGAARRLEDAECRRIFSDFHDARGRTLERNLEKWAMSPAEYLQILPFVDGSGEPLCRKPKVMLVSLPNVPRVIVCPGFARVQRGQPQTAESLVIHEVLHTLGLGENPPSSAEITQRVEARCR